MSSTSSPHPMIDVPDAIRIVLRETARLLLTQPARPPIQLSVAHLHANRDGDDPWRNQVLAEPVIMLEPGYPPYRASIMDGYAIRVADIPSAEIHNDDNNETTESSTTRYTHTIVDKIFAGDNLKPPESPSTPRLSTDSGLPTAYYVTTGAIVPDSFDCVVPVEDCTVGSDDDRHQQQRLAIASSSATIAVNKWIRPVGSDISAGSVVLPKGSVIDAVALGLLRQSGCTEVCLKRPVTVGVLSTGNELLVATAATAAATAAIDSEYGKRQGMVPDVNRPILLALLQSFGNCKCIDLGVARDDDIDDMTRILRDQLEHCEIIITTGGVSMGESDIVKDVLVDKLGGILHFGRLNMKPGKPTTFVDISSKYGKRLVFAMPGNPVSAIVCTQLLVRPCLDMLFAGAGDTDESFNKNMPADIFDARIHSMMDNALLHPEIEATLVHDIVLDAGRPEYHRVAVAVASDGSYIATSTGIQQSSRLMSMRDANGLLVLPKASVDRSKALAGETYTVLLIQNLPLIPRMRLGESKHLRPTKAGRDFLIGIVQVQGDETLGPLIAKRVTKALTGSKSGSVMIQSSRVFAAGTCKGLYDFLLAEPSVDIHVIVSSKYTGQRLAFHLDMVKHLRSCLSKVADAMALQARIGALSQDPRAAFFETTVGFIPNGRGSLVILVPEQGLDGALGNVRGLLKHALEVARSG